MNFNPANNMILSDGSISIKNLMFAAHQKARRDMESFKASRLYTEAEAAYWTYGRYFREAIKWAWDRARTLKALVAKGYVA